MTPAAEPTGHLAALQAPHAAGGRHRSHKQVW